MVSVCLPSDALLQHLPSYLGFSYLGHGVSLHGCSSKSQPLLLTLDEVAPPDLERGIAPHGPPATPTILLGFFLPWTWGISSWLLQQSAAAASYFGLGLVPLGHLPMTNIYWIMEKAREFQKNIYFCFIDYAKAFDYVDHNKL